MYEPSSWIVRPDSDGRPASGRHRYCVSLRRIDEIILRRIPGHIEIPKSSADDEEIVPMDMNWMILHIQKTCPLKHDFQICPVCNFQNPSSKFCVHVVRQWVRTRVIINLRRFFWKIGRVGLSSRVPVMRFQYGQSRTNEGLIVHRSKEALPVQTLARFPRWAILKVEAYSYDNSFMNCFRNITWVHRRSKAAEFVQKCRSKRSILHFWEVFSINFHHCQCVIGYGEEKFIVECCIDDSQQRKDIEVPSSQTHSRRARLTKENRNLSFNGRRGEWVRHARYHLHELQWLALDTVHSQLEVALYGPTFSPSSTPPYRKQNHHAFELKWQSNVNNHKDMRKLKFKSINTTDMCKRKK
ncbi:hypothetical protein SDJN02_24894, partial [Cucurbita argyrosperma subsp. argyrosperma]